ncbi:MAG: sensor histidine kinase [Pirellula sp.]
MRVPNSIFRWWIGFAAIVLVALVGLFIITKLVLKSEAAEAEARRVAALSENLRIALWRLDTALSPLIAQENLIAPSAFLTSQVAGAISNEKEIVSSSTSSSPFPITELRVLDRFEWDTETRVVRSIQSRMETLDDDLIAIAQQRRTSGKVPSNVEMKQAAPGSSQLSYEPKAVQSSNEALNAFNRDSRNSRDYQQRQQNSAVGNYLALENTFKAIDQATSLQPMIAVWHQERLMLIRSFDESNLLHIQGCQIDLEQLKRDMRSLVSDLFPEIDIVPLSSSIFDSEAIVDDYARLASLPLRLEPIVPENALSSHSIRPSTIYTLLVAWGAATFAIMAGGFSLAAFQRINHRRSLFVSSVTHELRTPLTTFQLYTDLLTQGIITEESQRRLYLETLKAEAFRLQHLVENILAFSRIERGRAIPEKSAVRLGEILDRIKSRMESAAYRGNMNIVWEYYTHANKTVFCNVELMEQILLNLVDNSCKYAATAADRRIVIASSVVNKNLHVSVRDFGPGFTSSSRWWKPFSKSAEQAAESAPGIGLGLALSESLAKQFSAKLFCDSVEAGAQVTLSLQMTEE